jgi:hypothetical protein
MNDRERRLHAIVEQALARPPEARRGFLESSCAADATLYEEAPTFVARAAELEGLLAATTVGTTEIASLTPPGRRLR